MTSRMDKTNSEYTGECYIADAVDRVSIDSEVAQPNPWDRPLGVAITKLRIEVIPNVNE